MLIILINIEIRSHPNMSSTADVRPFVVIKVFFCDVFILDVSLGLIVNHFIS